MALCLPIPVYRYDQKSKWYAIQSCVQYTVRGAPMPEVLTSAASQGMLSENVDLLKAVMGAPAVILWIGNRARVYNSSCEEISALPSSTEAMRLIRAFECPYVNVSTLISYYRLRKDGALVLVDTGRIQCAMCHIPEHIEDKNILRQHLNSRRHLLRKILRDRMIVVEIGDRTSVYSCDTLVLAKRMRMAEEDAEK